MNAVKIGMTIEEAAECTGIGRNTMRKLVDWGKLPVLKVGRKTIIRRDYLIANFKDAFGNNATASLLLDFAQKHMPEELANIQDGYNEVYEKRHQRIEEKKAALQ